MLDYFWLPGVEHIERAQVLLHRIDEATAVFGLVKEPFFGGFGGQVLYQADVCRRIADTTGRTLVDPSLWLQPASHRQWLRRMLNNLQATFAQTGRERDLYAMLELNDLLTDLAEPL